MFVKWFGNWEQINSKLIKNQRLQNQRNNSFVGLIFYSGSGRGPTSSSVVGLYGGLVVSIMIGVFWVGFTRGLAKPIF